MKKIFFAAAIAATLFSSCNKQQSTTKLHNEVDTISYAMGSLRSIPANQLKKGLSQAGSDSAYVKDFIQGVEDGINYSQDKRKLAYLIGLQQGAGLYMQDVKMLESNIFGNDSTKHLNVEAVIAGFREALEGKGSLLNKEGKPMSQQEMGMMIQEMIMALDAKNKEVQYADNKKASDDFMAKIAKKEGVKALGNGVYYEVNTEAEGKKAAKGETLEVEYEGRLADGTVFDASANHGGTAKFPVGEGRAIPGFDLALSNIPVGAEWTIYIPYDQAYQAQESGKIKPFSALIFKVKAIKIVEKEEN